MNTLERFNNTWPYVTLLEIPILYAKYKRLYVSKVVLIWDEALHLLNFVVNPVA